MIDIKYMYNTSDNNIDKEFVIPCLKWAKSYDRGVGYFTSGWLERNSEGLADFAGRGGTVRWIISPILSKEDSNFFINLLNEEEKYENLSNILTNNIDAIKEELDIDKLNVLGWMIYDGLIEIRFAIPKCKLSGDFHDKFGLFKNDDYVIGFSGSNNETIKGFSNYESFKVYKSWDGEPSLTYINGDSERFEKLWRDNDRNLKTYRLPQAVKEKIFKVRKTERPYKTNKLSKWRHQDEALEAFLNVGNGIICMATGTGKTRTAIKIIKKLYLQNNIKKVVITVSGNDLLNQWYEQLIDEFDDFNVFRGYGGIKEVSSFAFCKDRCILVISRDELSKSISKFKEDLLSESIIVCDEVHGIASNTLKSTLKGRLSKFKYRLGLSATPERQFDDEGNEFILNEIGEILYEFTLEKAIEREILCKFKYYPIDYCLTCDEKEKRAKLIKRMNYLKSNPKDGDYKNVLIDIARVKKTAINKINVFLEFIKQHCELLERCIIFVETIEYGYRLQEELININDNYKTYYGDDCKLNLDEFSNGDIDYLITSQKISEGVDIKTVKNIILFTADRSITQTTQRIGRALRTDPKNPNKYANIIDFISYEGENIEESAELLRKQWLSDLSKIGWE